MPKRPLNPRFANDMTYAPRRSIILPLGALLLAAFVTNAGAQTTVDGLIYASYRYGLVTDTTFTPEGRPNNFEIDRAYLSMRSRAAGGIATRVTIDVDTRRAAANQQTFRLKYAYADWTPEGSVFTYRLGMQNTPFIGYLEDLWGYRMQGTVPLDRYRYTSSSDLGFTVDMTSKTRTVTAHAGVFNGEGYSAAPGDGYKDVAGRLSVRLMETDNESRFGGLRLTGYASLGRATGGGTRQRLVGLLSYQTRQVTLGAELAGTVDTTAADPETKGRYTSLFATWHRDSAKVGFIARVDLFDPNTELSPAAFDAAASKQTRVIAGVSYRLAPSVRLLLDVDYATTEGSAVPNTFLTANRSIYLHTEIRF